MKPNDTTKWCTCDCWWKHNNTLRNHTAMNFCPFCGQKLRKFELTRREEGQRVKQIVEEVTGLKGVRVTSGRGTAHAWWHIKTPEAVTHFIQQEVERRCAVEHLVGRYLPDTGPFADWNACVAWETL